MSIPFGTDGWRGVIAEDCTFDAVRRVASATARVYRAGTGPGDRSRIVVGHDTRFFSPEFALALRVFARAASTSSRRRPSRRPRCVPVRRLGLAGGVAITASHNPAPYNGFKVKAHFGGSAPPELYEEISAQADRPLPAAPRTGRVERQDLLAPYRDGLASLVDLDSIRGSRLGVLADSIHGAAGTPSPTSSVRCALRVVPFRSTRDVRSAASIPSRSGTNSRGGVARGRREGSRILALAHDGDADRLACSTPGGASSRPTACSRCPPSRLPRAGPVGRDRADLLDSLLIDRVAAKLALP